MNKNALYLVGTSGSGKASLARSLEKRGYDTGRIDQLLTKEVAELSMPVRMPCWPIGEQMDRPRHHS